METIKRKDGYRYREMISINGKTVKGPSCRRKTDARLWKARKIAEVERLKAQGFDYNKNNTLFNEFSEKWLKEVVSIRNRRRTYDKYSSTLKNHILPLFGDIPLNKIELNHCNQLAASLNDKGHKATGMNTTIKIFKMVLNEATKQGYITRNPLSQFQNIPSSSHRERFFSKKELSIFLDVNRDDPLFPLYFAAFFTGMRRGELGGLMWDRVDFINDLIHVSRSANRYGIQEGTKSGKERFIPIHPKLKELLLKLSRDSSSKFVFTNKDDERVDVCHIHRKFKKAQTSAMIKEPMKFHDTRHTFASHFMMNGGSIFNLQKILGHSDIKMTMRYSHHSPEYLKNSVNFIDVDGVFNSNNPESNHVLKLVN